MRKIIGVLLILLILLLIIIGLTLFIPGKKIKEQKDIKASHGKGIIISSELTCPPSKKDIISRENPVIFIVRKEGIFVNPNGNKITGIQLVLISDEPLKIEFNASKKFSFFENETFIIMPDQEVFPETTFCLISFKNGVILKEVIPVDPLGRIIPSKIQYF